MSNKIGPDIDYNGHIIFKDHASQKIGLVIDVNNPDHVIIVDTLRHEGFLHDVFSLDTFSAIDVVPPVLVIAGPLDLTIEHVRKITEHVARGGAAIAVGALEPLENLLGIMFCYPVFHFPVGGIKHRSAGEGFIRFEERSTFSLSRLDDMFPLHVLGCLPVEADGSKTLVSFKTLKEPGTTWSAITKKNHGKGTCLHLALDLAGTIRRVQEGMYVDQDGIPPPDGMSPVDDGILKAEDGLVLDWERDRRVISAKARVPAFVIPVCDVLRKVLSLCIEHVSDQCTINVRRVDYWPDGASFVALISHDSDGNDESLGEHLLGEIDSHGIHTTWCIQPPGYSRVFCEKVVAHGHELALHFDSIAYPDNKMKNPIEMHGLFSNACLESQLHEILKNTGQDSIYSNKNHYTRWEGRVQFFEWCEKLGIRVDQSKGPSKCGTMGFPFGSCHPWQAIGPGGALIGCVEISFQSQDFGLQGPDDIANDLLERVKRVNGVAHVIFHPAHSKNQGVNKLMHQFIDTVVAMGGTFFTSKEIGSWYFTRKDAIARGSPLPPRSVLLERVPLSHGWRRVA
nr:hypothetical protein [Candidatus Sigynarchaeota archaeon]